MLGWPLPSSRFLINELLKWVDWQKANVIVEYGPGVGSFTIEILKRMRSNSVLVAVETNEDFIRYLRRKLHDRRLHLIAFCHIADDGQTLAARCLDLVAHALDVVPGHIQHGDLRALAGEAQRNRPPDALSRARDQRDAPFKLFAHNAQPLI